MSRSPVLSIERSGGVVVATLARPEASNAIDERLADALLAALDDLPEEVGALVVTGAGDRAFSAGADLRRMTELEGEDLERFLASTSRLFRSIAELPIATIAAVNGHAHGAGAEIACACDLRIGCPGATFRFPGIRYGLPVGTWHLPELVGLGRAKELLLTARIVEAEEAARIGLLQRLVPRERLLAEAIALGESIAIHPKDAVAAIKALLAEGSSRSSGSVGGEGSPGSIGSIAERMDREHAARNRGPLRKRARELMGGVLGEKHSKE